MDNWLRIGWIHPVTRANGFGIDNSLVLHVDLPIAGCRWVKFLGIVIDKATHAVNLLDWGTWA